MTDTKTRVHSTDTIALISRTLKRKDAAGILTAVDLTGLTVTFKMANRATNEPVTTAGSVIVDDAAAGEVSHDLTADEVDTPGIFAMWFVVEDEGETSHFPATTDGDLLYVDGDGTKAEDAYRAALA